MVLLLGPVSKRCFFVSSPPPLFELEVDPALSPPSAPSASKTKQSETHSLSLAPLLEHPVELCSCRVVPEAAAGRIGGGGAGFGRGEASSFSFASAVVGDASSASSSCSVATARFGFDCRRRQCS